MSSTIPDAAVEHALESQYTPLTLDAPLRRAGFNKAIGAILVASGVVAVLCAVVAATSGGGGGSVAIAVVIGLPGLLLGALGVLLVRSSLLIGSDGRVVVRGIGIRRLRIEEIARFEVGILPWSGSHRGPAPITVLHDGRRIPVLALNHSPLSFPSQFDRDIVAAICARLNDLIGRPGA